MDSGQRPPAAAAEVLALIGLLHAGYRRGPRHLRRLIPPAGLNHCSRGLSGLETMAFNRRETVIHFVSRSAAVPP
ncbi:MULTISPECIES: hypothetical protein [unclassified Mesorhizobium]|uniref:hypothetical protein n=1 Tax=unclassified Mesorhizobium TaxID=325217 RepID=UPI001092C3D0|nr:MULTISPECIES: hypothetical protein [unclassified Mesorhizobium]TGP49707.1 hypothetical protein EN873_27575 [bacterium M00.F.Ca.ET.230.01.1.1]